MPPPTTIDRIIGKALGNIGVPGLRNSRDPTILETIDIPLGLLGILRCARAAHVGECWNDWKSIGKHRYSGAAECIGFAKPQNQ